MNICPPELRAGGIFQNILKLNTMSKSLKKQHRNGTLNHPEHGEIKLSELSKDDLESLGNTPGYSHLFVDKDDRTVDELKQYIKDNELDIDLKLKKSDLISAIEKIESATN